MRDKYHSKSWFTMVTIKLFTFFLGVLNIVANEKDNEQAVDGRYVSWLNKMNRLSCGIPIMKRVRLFLFTC